MLLSLAWSGWWALDGAWGEGRVHGSVMAVVSE